MFESLFVLASYGFFQGGGIGDLFNYWEEMGFFSYVLPFLLIFALVYVTLSSMALFKANKGVSGVIAFCVGLLALQFDVVPLFFSEIFPRVGIALSAMLAVLIILGLFLDPNQKWTNYMLLGMAFVAVLIVLFQQANSTFFYDIFYFFDAQIFAWLMMGLIVAVIIFAIIGFPKPKPFPPHYPLLFYPSGGPPQERAGGP